MLKRLRPQISVRVIYGAFRKLNPLTAVLLFPTGVSSLVRSGQLSLLVISAPS
ncbi:hypothetical protein BN903_62 [Halorubrum sp. AJ67]|nr:hypothetical protein BN903_62 [Halorubrum sp. AJ67]